MFLKIILLTALATLPASVFSIESVANSQSQKINEVSDAVNSIINITKSHYASAPDSFRNKVYCGDFTFNNGRSLTSYGIERIVVGFADASVSRGGGNTNVSSFDALSCGGTSDTTNNGFTNNLVNYSNDGSRFSCTSYSDTTCDLVHDCAYNHEDKFLIEIDFCQSCAFVSDAATIAGKKLLFVAVSPSSSHLRKSSFIAQSADSTQMGQISTFDCYNVKGQSNDGINNGSRFGELGSVNLGQSYISTGVPIHKCFDSPNFRNCSSCTQDALRFCS